ncbi:hypothetical protein [Rathayibacter sp. Leaf296]|uniref:hypothetical protein n=1 Tax=Rathayibacter sp. Leaf296 TaxID=1736327 RepID=UPI000702BB88|nr:hypothetical protein [Rathayibacter sp. Leaf296]KQQ07569.1 hypothetical protein ASF46_18190 [Rathayibacter sp. Leaf296]
MITAPTLEMLRAEKERAVAAFVAGDVPAARRTLLRVIADLERFPAAPPDPQLTRELANCEFDLGVVESVAGSFTEACRRLERAAESYSGARERSRSLLQLALVLLRSGRSAARAATITAEAIPGADSDDPRDRALLVAVRAGIAESQGDRAGALALLDREATGNGDARATAGLRARLGALLLRLGRHDEAVVQLTAAHTAFSAYEHRLDALLVAVELALVSLDRGLAADAHGKIMTILRSTQGESGSPSCRLGEGSPVRARCLDLLGTIDRGRGGVDATVRSITQHREASALFAAGGWVHQSAISTLNEALDHLVMQRSRAAAHAAGLVEEALGVLEDGSSTGPEASDGRVALGIARSLLHVPGDRAEAMTAFHAAAEGYAAAGLLLEQSTALHDLGWILAEEAFAARERGDDPVALEDRALGLLIPAALVRDASRYDISIPHHRRAWWARHAEVSWGGALRVAFEAGRTELAAELILRARRAGAIDLVTAETRSEDDAPLEGLELPSMSASLPAGAVPPALRLVPGPRIEMPSDGRLALADYEDSAAATYRLDPARLRSSLTAAVL